MMSPSLPPCSKDFSKPLDEIVQQDGVAHSWISLYGTDIALTFDSSGRFRLQSDSSSTSSKEETTRVPSMMGLQNSVQSSATGTQSADHASRRNKVMNSLVSDVAIEKLSSKTRRKRTHSDVSKHDAIASPSSFVSGVHKEWSLFDAKSVHENASSRKDNIFNAALNRSSGNYNSATASLSSLQKERQNALGDHGSSVYSADQNVFVAAPCASKVDLQSLLVGTSQTVIDTRLRTCDHLRRKIESHPNLRVILPAKSLPLSIVKGRESTLHRACQQSTISVQEIELLLRQDPTAASQSMTLMRNKQVVEPASLVVETKCMYEPYTYPLHIAIHNRVNADVIKCLIRAAPSVLSIQDGPLRETPLFLLLKYSPDIELVDIMLLENPKSVLLKDRRDNTVLHIACQRGVSTAVLRHLCILYPKALNCTNFNGKTPLEIAQSQSANPFAEDTCNFLMDFQHAKYCRSR